MVRLGGVRLEMAVNDGMRMRARAWLVRMQRHQRRTEHEKRAKDQPRRRAMNDATHTGIMVVPEEDGQTGVCAIRTPAFVTATPLATETRSASRGAPRAPRPSICPHDSSCTDSAP